VLPAFIKSFIIYFHVEGRGEKRMKIGLFISRSNGVIDRAIDINNLIRHFSREYQVFVVDNFFSKVGLSTMLSEIEKNQFEAVVLAGESPLNYQNNKSADFVINQIEALGVNSNKIGFANIKEQVALAHPHYPRQATEKAKALVEVAIEKVRVAHPIRTRDIAPHPAVAIIGATPGGIIAAQKLLERNFKVYIVDKTDGIRNFSNQESQDKIKSVVTYVEMHPKAKFLFNTRITDIYGYAGRFFVEINTSDELANLTVGSMVVANTADLEFTAEIRPLVHIDINDEGFFKPVNPDTMQVYTYEPGIFLLPDDESQSLAEIVAISDSVAFAVTAFLESDVIHYKITVSEINESLCSGCGTCVKTCMFKASSINPMKKVSIIDEQRCKGCGNCVTSCPTGARDLLTYPNKYLTKAIEILSKCDSGTSNKVLAFLCESCGYKALDLAGEQGINYDVNIMPLGIRCGGNIDTQLILEAYKYGFGGIIICKCPDDNCRNIVGNTDLDRRANLFREILRSRGLESDTLLIVEGIRAGKNNCAHAIQALYQDINNDGGGN
jgi:heterodisulfide reductase subunit A-like polyferredoxin/coenzyme F420-reducing hydrogenase delta subunit